MEPEDLPDPDDLWWSWVVLAALHRAVDDPACRFDAQHRVLHLDAPDGSWLRMQRVLGDRSVLWGCSALAAAPPKDARTGAPDWAVTDATLADRPSFVAWHAHDEWDASSPGEDEGAIHLLRPLLTVDPKAVDLLRGGTTDPRVLSPWTDGPHLDECGELLRLVGQDAPVADRATTPAAVRSRLRDQVHDQMRDALERDRILVQRPPRLVQWSRVNGPGVAFEHAVMVVRGRLSPSPRNSRLPDPVARSLANVLRTLHREEAHEESGAWLFARVSSDGVVIGFDRAFDSWPPWYAVRHPSQGPALDDLAWEMRQRTPPWRPAWASLLPS